MESARDAKLQSNFIQMISVKIFHISQFLDLPNTYSILIRFVPFSLRCFQFSELNVFSSLSFFRKDRFLVKFPHSNISRIHKDFRKYGDQVTAFSDFKIMNESLKGVRYSDNFFASLIDNCFNFDCIPLLFTKWFSSVSGCLRAFEPEFSLHQ